MHLPTYLGLLHTSLRTVADGFRLVGRAHPEERDLSRSCQLLATRIDVQVAALDPVVERYGKRDEAEPERLHAVGLDGARPGAVGLLRDLHDLYVLASFADISWSVVTQAARVLRDYRLLHLASSAARDTADQLRWLRTRIEQAAPQVLIATR